MNAGGPLATPLRAVRRPPVLVDDAGRAAQLTAAATALLPIAGLEIGADDLARWTRAWLVVWQGVLQARGVIGGVDPTTIAVPLADVPTLKGDPAGLRRAAAETILERAGLLRRSPDGSTATPTGAMFVEHRAGLELDWTAIARAVRLEPAPLLVARALAELIVPAAAPSRVTLREVAIRTGYAPKQVRVALRRLVAGGVLADSEAPGMPTQYRFLSAALDRGGVAPVERSPRLASVAPDRAPLPSPVPPAPATERTVALRMTVNGVTVSLGPGLAPHVELGPDGVPQISFDRRE